MATVNKENANKIRAGIISAALDVEDALTLVLGYWYCPNDIENEAIPNRLIEDVLADLTFDKKIKLLKGFVDKFPDLFPDGLIRELNEIRETRNQMAHRIFHDPKEMADLFPEIDLDTPEEFNFLKVGKDSFTLTMADLDKYEILCYNAKYAIYLSASDVVKRLL